MAGMMTGQAVPSRANSQEDEERRMMQIMEQMQQRRAPNAAIAMTPEAQQQMQNFQAGRQQAAQPLQSVSGGSGTAKPEAPGLLSRLGRAGLDRLQDPESRARIAMALNSMRLQPDQGLARSLQGRAEGIQERRQQAQQANRTVEYLKSKGRPDLAQAVEANPSLAAEALKATMGVTGDQFATKGFAPQIDPVTGQMFGVQYDPNTGEYSRVNVPGAVGETPSEVTQRESSAKLELQDYQAAQEAGTRAFTQAQAANRTIGTMYSAISAIESGGRSGVLDQFLPAFDAATATLRNAATTMGIDIINSATFGALSEAELALALSSGIPLGLDGPELQEFLYKKIEAQTLLRNELLRTAQTLSGGQMKYSDFINQYKVEGGTKPMNVTEVSPKDLGR